MSELRQPVNSFLDFNEGVTMFSKQVAETNTPKVMILKEVAKPHNYEFHKKLFGLIKFAYENTELPQVEIEGKTIVQGKGKFRNDLVVMSGFYTQEVTRKGGLILVADSLAYDKCSESKKEKIFNAMLDVVAGLLSGSGYTREKLEKLSEQWVSFT